MNFADLLSYVITSLRYRKLRAYLTILGIVIGIASIVILISLAQGLDASIRSQLSVLGTNYVFVIPGSVGASSFRLGPPVLRGQLTTRDVDAIREVQGVVAVSGNIAYPLAEIEFKGEKTGVSLAGVEPSAFSKFITTGYDAGRFISDGDTSGAVIGWEVANTYFKKNVTLGSTIRVNGHDFRVKGILSKVGNTGPQDTAVYVDQKVVRAMLGSSYARDRVTTIIVVTNKDIPISRVSDEIDRRLQALHKVTPDNKDYTLFTADSIAAQISQVTGILSVFLAGVAAISLLVGGIGIANAMFTSVFERTREIGILKSIGANDAHILQLFLLESGLIGLIGGIVGVMLGFATGLLLSVFGVPTIITPELVIFSIAFSFAVGMVSGYFPAKNAAALQPIEALRYE